MEWIAEAFEPAFMQRALLGGVLTVIATSVVGTWVVLRGMAFLGDALAHGIVPGIALALLWGFSPVLGALVAALVMSGLVALVSARPDIREDTGIGLLFVGMLSLGVVIVSRSDSFTTDLTALLFGDVLAVTGSDLGGQAVVAGGVLVATVVLYRPLLALTFHRQKATTLRMHPGWTHTALMALLASSVVAAYRTIGTLLVFGLLVAPPATAALFVRRVPLVMGTAALIGSASVAGGLLISYHAGTAGGATISALAVAIFFAGFAVAEVGARRRSARPLPSPT